MFISQQVEGDRFLLRIVIRVAQEDAEPLAKEGVLSFFRLNRRERFSLCSHVTQRIRETRSTPIGNTLLGNTVLPTHVKEHAMPKSADYTLTWSSSSQAHV